MADRKLVVARDGRAIQEHADGFYLRAVDTEDDAEQTIRLGDVFAIAQLLTECRRAIVYAECNGEAADPEERDLLGWPVNITAGADDAGMVGLLVRIEVTEDGERWAVVDYGMGVDLAQPGVTMRAATPEEYGR